MRIENSVKNLIAKIHSGKMKNFLNELDGSDFGLYIPIYVNKNIVSPMPKGYSQTESNLTISISKNTDDILSDAKTVAWMGWQNSSDAKCEHKPGKDSRCNHTPGGPIKCRHCTQHKGHCRHCTHKNGGQEPENNLVAPELKYDLAVATLNDKRDLLEALAKEGFGLALLHGHNDEFMFTKLPEGYIAVITDNQTIFRTDLEVEQDSEFVPNMWRSINGQLRIAGGYSTNQKESLVA